MVGLLFHVLYLLGKCIYDRYRVRKTRLLPDVAYEEELFRYDYDALNDSELENTLWWTHGTIGNFYPPAYIQRYCAAMNVLNEYKGKLWKIVDYGCGELGLLLYLKGIPEVEQILCVDVDREVLERYKEKAAPLTTELLSSRERKLTIEICEGSVTDNDVKLKNANAVICIELIEHLYPDTLIDLPFNIFGYIKPEVAIITTPNMEYNVVFPHLSGYRHPDHKFEWTREQFQDWAQNIVVRYPYYRVTFHGICNGPEGTEEFGALTQMAVFHRISPRKDSRLEILMPDEYIQLKGQHSLFNTVATYKYSTGHDIRSDEQKVLDEAIYYINYLSYSINDEDEPRVYEIYLDRILSFMTKYTISTETLRSILTDAGWSIVDRENGPANLHDSPNFTDENRWDYESSINETPAYIDEEYLSTQNLDTENWFEERNFTDVMNRWDNKSDDSYINQVLDANEYSSAQNPHIENWHEEPSIIIPENCSINQENTYLFDGENDLVEESQPLKEPYANNDDIKQSGVKNVDSLVYTERELPSNSIALTLNEVEAQVTASNMSAAALNNSLTLKTSDDEVTVESALLQNDQINLRTMEEIASMSNFQSHMSVSRSSTSLRTLYFSSEMNNSLQDFSTCYQNESSINNQCLLNSTFHQSEMATGAAMNTEDSTAKDIPCFKESLPKKNTQDEINFLLHTPDKNQIYEDNDMTNVMSLDAYSFNNKPKYTSSPHTKTSTTHIVNKSLKYRELKSAMNSSVLLDTPEEIKEIVSDIIDNILLKFSQESNSSITETIKPHATSSSSNFTNTSRQDIDSSASNSTQQNLCLENKEFSDVDNSMSAELIQGINKEFTENNINHESIVSDIQNADASYVSLGNESINHKDKSVYCTLAKTDLTKAHLENIISDLAQLSIKKKGLNPPRELLNSKSQSISKYSSSDCAKEISILRNDKFVPCKSSEDTSNVFTSALKNEENVSTSKDVSNAAGMNNVEVKPFSPLETPPNSWSPEIMDSGYPNSVSAQDITPEYELPSIAQDYIPDSESPSIAEAPRLGVLEPIEVENGDLANNNRDDEGNNMMAVDANDIENLQPLIDVLENDLENENDIYVMQNGFPIWLLRILDMANPLDFDMQARQNLRIPDEAADDVINYVGQDEGFDSSSSESESDVAYNEMENDNGHGK
ncbi:HENMT methyltransferase, partial [Acromyrmex insinuator]